MCHLCSWRARPESQSIKWNLHIYDIFSLPEHKFSENNCLSPGVIVGIDGIFVSKKNFNLGHTYEP